MFTINENYLSLPHNYLFAEIRQKVEDYKKTYPQIELIQLGIGDVTLPLVPAVVEAMKSAVEEMGRKETFKGYGGSQGYGFLRNVIAESDYRKRGCDISADEIFISDGAKSDISNLQEIFSVENKVAVCNPVYPVYTDINIMAGRAGQYDPRVNRWRNIIYMDCTKETNFLPEIPKRVPDMIYLCFPNNPTGAVMKKEELQEWVDYANQVGAIIFFDSAYEGYISEKNVPHTIYECEGAKMCAIEVRSFSKKAGFTGLRLGATVIPKEIRRKGVTLHSLWKRRQETKYNGTSYIVQKAGEATYTKEGRRQIAEQIKYYMRNAKKISTTLSTLGYTVVGGENSPYIWVKTPYHMKSWDFFTYLLENANVVGTSGSGFGAAGEGYFRLTGFGSEEDTKKALERISALPL
ncbi:LL-diaminopimelate aminotransferase [Faecalimonas sp.]